MHNGMSDWHWGFGVGHWSLSILLWIVIFLAVYGLFTIFSGPGKE